LCAAAQLLQAAALVVPEEEGPVLHDRAPEAGAVPILVGVGIRVVSLSARQRLRIRERIQFVRIEVRERGPVEAVRTAFRGDNHSCETAVLRAVGIREDLHFRNGVETRRRIRQLAEDARARGLSVLDVRRAVGPPAQELNAVEAADDVWVERQEVLDVSAVPRQVAQLLLVEPSCNRLALERDVVLSFGAHGDDVFETAHFQVQIGADDRGRAQDDARRLRLLESGEGRRDGISAGTQVGDLEQSLRVGQCLACDVGGLVGRHDRGARHDALLLVGDRPPDRP